MAHIQKRERNGQVRWRARYRTSEGDEVSRTFRRREDARRWLDEVTADVLTGRYADPRRGQVTLAKYAEEWLEAQTFDESTREAVASRLRSQIIPHLGSKELRSIRPSTVQAWLRGRQEECAPTYVRVLLANLSSILGAAVDDARIATNPCRAASVKAPKVPDKRVVPWTREQVDAVVAAHPESYRAVPVVAAGCGLRQGETFGIRVDDVDFLRRRLYVRQQVKQINGRPVLAPPKGGKQREVPLPDVVAAAISERLRLYPAGEDGLVFTSREHGMLDRNHYNPYVWKPALREAGIEPTRENGMHALRHHYASVLLEGGVSIRAVAEYLGHADPGFTLRTYTHLMPTSEDRTRAVVDAAFGPRLDPAAAPLRPRA